MLKRLIVGLILGTLIGAAFAAALVRGFGMVFFPNAILAYGAAAAVGVVTGLVAGKPIWSADGKIEAGLKAFFGALLGMAVMYALRWVHIRADLTMLNAGEGPISWLPAASLPMVGAALAAFYEVDNTPNAESDSSGASAGSRVRADKKVRVKAEEEGDDREELEEEGQGKKGRHH